MLETYLSQLDLCYFEISEAFKGLDDAHVWKRPHPRLLSVGELAGHVAYWEARRFAGDGTSGDISTFTIHSPLLDSRFAYYTTNVPVAPSDDHLTLTTNTEYFFIRKNNISAQYGFRRSRSHFDVRMRP